LTLHLVVAPTVILQPEGKSDKIGRFQLRTL
jgi:hypothetical protein